MVVLPVRRRLLKHINWSGGNTRNHVWKHKFWSSGDTRYRCWDQCQSFIVLYEYWYFDTGWASSMFKHVWLTTVNDRALSVTHSANSFALILHHWGLVLMMSLSISFSRPCYLIPCSNHSYSNKYTTLLKSDLLSAIEETVLSHDISLCYSSWVRKKQPFLTNLLTSLPTRYL